MTKSINASQEQETAISGFKTKSGKEFKAACIFCDNMERGDKGEACCGGNQICPTSGITSQESLETSNCSLYKRKCIGGYCSATPYPEVCQYLKPNNGYATGINSQDDTETIE